MTESATGTRAAAPAGRSPSARVLTTHEQLESIAGAWEALHAISESENPFSHPAWALTWARHFVPAGHLRVLAVWEDDRLTALAPLYQSRRIVPLSPRRVRPLGTGGPEFVTEVFEVLSLPERRRNTLRTVIEQAHAVMPGWDRLELAVTPEQGWLEADFGADRHDSRVVNFHTDAFIVFPLEGDEEPKFKRNMSESVRRAKNRLERDSHSWKLVEYDSPGDVAAHFERFAQLHSARATLEGRSVHVDHMELPQQEAFVRDASIAMAERGMASLFFLELDGSPDAALLALRAGRSTYISVTGFDPRWWEYKVMTLLLAEVIADAARRGHRRVNLGREPSGAKYRWSEETQLYPHFAIVRGGIRARSGFKLFLHRRSQFPSLTAVTVPSLSMRARRAIGRAVRRRR